MSVVVSIPGARGGPWGCAKCHHTLLIKVGTAAVGEISCKELFGETLRGGASSAQLDCGNAVCWVLTKILEEPPDAASAENFRGCRPTAPVENALSHKLSKRRGWPRTHRALLARLLLLRWCCCNPLLFVLLLHSLLRLLPTASFRESEDRHTLLETLADFRVAAGGGIEAAGALVPCRARQLQRAGARERSAFLDLGDERLAEGRV